MAVKPALTHAELCDRAARWLRLKWNCGVVIKEIPSWVGGLECPDAIGWVNAHSILVECKTSVADFKRDAAKTARKESDIGMGNLRFFLAEKGVLDGQVIPEGWGLYEVCGKTVKFSRGVAGWDCVRFKITGGYPFPNTLYSRHQEVNILTWALRKGTKNFDDNHEDIPVFRVGDPVYIRLQLDCDCLSEGRAPDVVAAVIREDTGFRYRVGDFWDDCIYSAEELVRPADVFVNEVGDLKAKTSSEGGTVQPSQETNVS